MIVNFNAEYSGPHFQRKPNAQEMVKYSRSLREGLRVLDKKVGIIIHNSSVPSFPKQNLGIGTLLSKNAREALVPFLAAHAYSTIQQEPDNIRGAFKPSPYIPISSSKNVYMIPLEILASDEYNNILSKKDIETLSEKNSKRKFSNKVDYNFIHEEYTRLLKKAFKNFSIKANTELIKEFEEFKNNKYTELEPNAVYEILVLKNKDEDWKNWKSDVDRNLYTSEKYKDNLKNFIEKHQAEIDLHIFKQWILERETAQAKINNDKFGIRVIADSPVAIPPAVVWRNKELYFDDLALGCPPDDFSPDGQRWGFAVLKPETIFNADGSLGAGGILLKKQYEKMFETSSGGARIDHIIGLIDPFVYSTKEPKMTESNSGRLYSSPNHPILGKYAKNTQEQYAAIIEKIVIPAAEKYGLTKDDIICEDLGFLSEPVRNIMEDKALTGIAVTQYDYRGKDTPSKNIIMPGSHDNKSFIEYTDMMFSEREKAHLEEKSIKLADDTIVPRENWDQYRWGILTDKAKFMAASFTELFTSPAKKVQIFFTDFFGIGETYNTPGKENGCWSLRLPENFESLYYKNLQKGTAINLPEVIARAIRNRGEEFENNNKELLKDLDTFTRILKS